MSYFDQSLVFTKMHVNGNDFLVVNELLREYSLKPNTIRTLGDRRKGVGFDQLLLIKKPDNSDNDVAVEFYNSNGSITGQCGNGCAAITAFLHKHQLVTKPTICLERSHQITECSLASSSEKDCYMIDVNLGVPCLHPDDIPFLVKEQQVQYQLNVPGQESPLLLSVLSMGNPHAVMVVPNVDQVLLDELGTKIQQHEAFPESTNVEVLEIQDESNGKLRVLERGVGETQACGTGAAAAMVVGRLLNQFTSRVEIVMPGGSTNVEWEGPTNSVILQCKPTFVYTGTWTY